MLVIVKKISVMTVSMIKKSNSKVLKKREKKNKSNVFVVIFKWLTILGFLVMLSGVAGLAGLYLYISRDLPKINSLEDYRPSIVSSVFSDDGTKIGEFYKERRIVVPLSEMPDYLIQAFVAAEDARFRKHGGVDIYSIFRAFFKNLKAGGIVQGGSTITQQVTKSFLLTPARTYERKLKEAVLAYRIDKKFSKDDVLFLYLNQIYLGHGAYGVEAASENYFGKHVKDLNLAECSLLAGLPQAPSRYSPFRHPERARQRQSYVLNRMMEEGYISKAQASEALELELNIHPRKNWFIESVPCYTEHVRRYVVEKYGEEALYHQGLKVYTAVSIELQKIARKAVVKSLIDLDRRQGYRGPLKHIPSLEIDSFNRKIADGLPNKFLEPEHAYQGVVVKVDDAKKETHVRVGNAHGIIPLKDMAWARKPNVKIDYTAARITRPGKVFKTGDVIEVRAVSLDEKTKQWVFSLEQEPRVQAALLSIEAETGHVKSMIGGRDFKNSQFNRAIQSRRQPGSAFKPVIYAAALDKGYTAASVIIDSPVVFKNSGSGSVWKPHNYNEKFYGPTLFRHALVKSRNVVTVKILQDIGIDYVIDYAKKLGITSPISRDLSISLGSSGLSLLEIVNAYAVFSNLGYWVEPVFIIKIVDRDGNLIEHSELKRNKVIDMSTAYIMTSILESVVKSGTGWRVRELNRPAAGKTGTTNDLYDAWFIGYTPRYTTGVWVGFDRARHLGKNETGSRAASPIWLDYMKDALEGRPVRTFSVPEGVVFVKIDAETGLLPIDSSQNIIFECFKEGTVPKRYTPAPDSFTEPDDLFKSDI